MGLHRIFLIKTEEFLSRFLILTGRLIGLAKMACIPLNKDYVHLCFHNMQELLRHYEVDNALAKSIRSPAITKLVLLGLDLSSLFNRSKLKVRYNLNLHDKKPAVHPQKVPT